MKLKKNTKKNWQNPNKLLMNTMKNKIDNNMINTIKSMETEENTRIITNRKKTMDK